MQNLINQAADLIKQYNPKLAIIWNTQPFNRVNAALAFAKGFNGEDINATASLVLQVAYLDRDYRERMGAQK